MVTPVEKRKAVAHLETTYEMSERRACRLAGADRTMIRYEAKRPDDRRLRDRMVELSHDRRRFGYRRLHVLLKAEGLVVNRKKTERIYREEGLKVRRRAGRKRAVGKRADQNADAPKRALVARFRARPVFIRAALSHFKHRRRCNQAVLGGCSRYVPFRAADHSRP